MTNLYLSFIAMFFAGFSAAAFVFVWRWSLLAFAVANVCMSIGFFRLYKAEKRGAA